MYADKVLRVQYAVFILIEIVSRLSARCMIEYAHVNTGELQPHTWPAVSIISVAKSWPLTRMTLLNVFSMVG